MPESKGKRFDICLQLPFLRFARIFYRIDPRETIGFMNNRSENTLIINADSQFLHVTTSMRRYSRNIREFSASSFTLYGAALVKCPLPAIDLFFCGVSETPSSNRGNSASELGRFIWENHK